jgi:hypothetical protein
MTVDPTTGLLVSRMGPANLSSSSSSPNAITAAQVGMATHTCFSNPDAVVQAGKLNLRTVVVVVVVMVMMMMVMVIGMVMVMVMNKGTCGMSSYAS